jgi:very-short-patch-repair endonuclease
MKDKRQMFHGATPGIFENARLLRDKQTKYEKMLWEELKSNKILGLRFKAQHPIDVFVADFYCHKLRLVIEIDGEYHLAKQQSIYDSARTDRLGGHGVTVLRFTNSEVEKDRKGVVDRITKACKELSQI